MSETKSSELKEFTDKQPNILIFLEEHEDIEESGTWRAFPNDYQLLLDIYKDNEEAITFIKKKSNKEDLTFKELYELTGKNLVVTGTGLNKRESHFYTRFSNPNMPIFKAIEISTALPFLFPPIKWGEDLLVDGGILENFPIYYIKDDGSFPNSRTEVVKYKVNRKHSKINESVLGIKVTSIVEKKDKFNDSIDTIAKFGLSIFNTLVTQIERTSIKKGYYDNVIDIVLNDTIDNFELKLSESKKQELFNLGYSFTQKFLEK
jgi:predicted acylesterase/phospholipase RssA